MIISDILLAPVIIGKGENDEEFQLWKVEL